MLIQCINWVAVSSCATAAMSLLTFIALIQTRRSIKNNRKKAFVDQLHSALNACFETRSNIIIDNYTFSPKPNGIKALEFAYETLFKSALTKTVDKSLKLTEQKENNVVPKMETVKRKIEEIMSDVKNLRTYIGYVLFLFDLIESEDYLSKEDKRQCINQICSLLTEYELLWVYYYCMANGGNNVYNYLPKIADKLPQDKTINFTL